MSAIEFSPWPPLVPGASGPATRACVVIPARNEAESLPRCLEALRLQRDLHGAPLPWTRYEVLLLLNNCTDGSATVCGEWHREHPELQLQVLERSLPKAEAHVGTARRLLMDTAWCRLRGAASEGAILSTDADSVVPPDWIAANLQALQLGADVVGGSVQLLPEELRKLPCAVQHRYRQDRRYAALIAELEALSDPQPGDPMPRHLDHFGSSLACSTTAYAAAGGLPAVSPLEDEAFVDRVRRAGLCLRHDPRVRVFTSARMEGRATTGLAGLLRMWAEMPSDEAHTVPSAAFVEHRFQTLAALRGIFEAKQIGNFPLPTSWWCDTFANALQEQTSCPGFLEAVYCDVLVRESFQGAPEESIECAIAGLEGRLVDCTEALAVVTI